MCLTANPTLEWIGSDFQMPVGMVDSALRCGHLNYSFAWG